MNTQLEQIFLCELEKQCNYGLFCEKHLNDILQRLSSSPSDFSNNIEEFWFYVQGFLISAANISKILWGADKPQDNKKRFKERKPLRQKLEIDDRSALNDRQVRNCFEHFDEKIEKWAIKNKGFVDSNIGQENMIGNMKKSDHIRFYEIDKHIISFQGKEFPMKPVAQQMIELRESVRQLLPHN